MLKRSIHISTRVDDDGGTLYEISETRTVSTHIRTITQAEYAEAAREVAEFNEQNSDFNQLKQAMARQTEEMNNSPDPRAHAIARLIRAGILYPDGTSKEYEDDGDLIPFNEIKRRRANAVL